MANKIMNQLNRVMTFTATKVVKTNMKTKFHVANKRGRAESGKGEKKSVRDG